MPLIAKHVIEIHFKCYHPFMALVQAIDYLKIEGKIAPHSRNVSINQIINSCFIEDMPK